MKTFEEWVATTQINQVPFSDTNRAACEGWYARQPEIDELKSENFMLTNERDNSRNSVIYLINENKALKAEVEKLRKDAERLDFLDSNKDFSMGWKVNVAPVGNLSVRGIIMGGLPIREAIDAAMKETK
jgi:FtsZ-binding cell division protein ZapB